MTIETATEQSAQDMTSRVEDLLYGSDTEAELESNEDEVVSEDEAILPEDDDTESDDKDGSVGLDDIAEEDESLAAYLGLDEEKLSVKDDGSVVFNAIIDGEPKEVALKDLASSYQLQGHVNNKSIALENERKEFEAQRSQVASEYEARLKNVNDMTAMVEKQLIQDFNNVDWDRLRVENPSEWSAMRQEYAEKAQSIQQMQTQIGSEQKQLSDQNQAQQQQNHQVYMQDQMSKMINANPSWSNQEVMKAETGKLKAFLEDSYGFTGDDLQYVTDHRLIGLIQDAKAFRSGKKGAESKISKSVPKFQKPGASKGNSKSLEKARGVKARMKAFKKTGSTQDAANLLLDRM